jgi:hypothetical protein
MSLLSRIEPQSNAQRLAGYYRRLATTGPSPIEIGWRAEAGMRFLRALNARPSPLLQPEQARRPTPSPGAA